MVTRKKSAIWSGNFPQMATRSLKPLDRALTPDKALVWAEKPSWKLEEALKLASGIDPDLVQAPRREEPRRVRVIHEQDPRERSLRDFVIRARRADRLKAYPTPASFLTWLKSHNFPIAQTLLDAAEILKIINPTTEAINACSASLNNAETIADLRTKVIELERQLAEAKKQIANEELHPRVENNLQSLTAAIAVEKYRWRADKSNSAATNIESCLLQFGIELRSETILKHIKAGYERHKSNFDTFLKDRHTDYEASAVSHEAKLPAKKSASS